MTTPAEERLTTEGPVYTVTGGDWDTLIDEEHDDRIVVNMGPQHPSTHGVLRLVLELEGETVTQARSVIGYLHTGIEKNCEYRTWTQGVTFVTRADYLSPLFTETGYCLGVEKLLGRRGAAAGPAGPRHADGDQPDRLAPGGAGHRRHGARRAHRHDQRVPRARGPAAPAGAAHRPAHEPRVHPPRRPRAGLPGRLRRGRPGRRQADPRPAARLRQAAHRPADLAPAAGERGLPAARRLPGARRHRPDPAVRGPAVGPAQGRALLRLRGVRLRGADGHRGRLLRALPPAGAGDAGVAQDHRAGGQGDGARPGDGRGPQDRLARAAVDRLRRHGQHARTRQEDHGSVDGVADPPLQAGHRGLRGACRARCTRRSSRRAASWASTSSPTAAPGRCACTCASPAS